MSSISRRGNGGEETERKRGQVPKTSDRAVSFSGFTLLVPDSEADETLPDAGCPSWSTSTVYNSVGQVLSTTDRSGLTTATTYHLRGQTIQTRGEQFTENGQPSAWSISRTVYEPT